MLKWLKKYGKEKRKVEFDAGYGWACTQNIRYKVTLPQLQAEVWRQEDEFDKGAMQAIHDLLNKGVPTSV